MARVKAEIIVQGTVQKAGYRDYVQEIARRLNVKGYVENLRDGSVRILCEADEDVLKRLIEQINVKEDLIEVENVEVVKTQPSIGEFQYFDIKYGPLEEEIGERMVAGLKIAVATRQDIKGMHLDLKSMHQDLKESTQSMHQDLKTSITSMHKDLKGGITSMHHDLKESTDSMRQDLKDSITSMHRDLKDSTDSMHQDMNLRFEEMAKRYDTISTELLRTREELQRSVDNLVKLIQKFLEKT